LPSNEDAASEAEIVQQSDGSDDDEVESEVESGVESEIVGHLDEGKFVSNNIAASKSFEYDFNEAIKVIFNDKNIVKHVPFEKLSDVEFVVISSSTKVADGCGIWNKEGRILRKVMYKMKQYDLVKSLYRQKDDPQYTRIVWRTENRSLFQYFGTYKGSYKGFPLTVLTATELLLNYPSCVKTIPAKKRSRVIYKVSKDFIDNCVSKCHWKYLKSRFHKVYFAFKTKTCSTIKHYKHNDGKIINVKKGSYFSVCNKDNEKIVFETQNSKLIQYVGLKSEDCTCISDNKLAFDRLAVVKANMHRSSTHIYIENTHLFDRKHDVENCKRKIDPYRLVSKRNEFVAELANLIAAKDNLQQFQFTHHSIQGNCTALVLYSKESLVDLLSLGQNNQNVVLHIDETFNMFKFLVTCTSYLNPKLVTKGSDKPPLFAGPLLLHSVEDVPTFLKFFGHIKSELLKLVGKSVKAIANIIFCSNGQAVNSALNMLFPNNLKMSDSHCISKNIKQKCKSKTGTIAKDLLTVLHSSSLNEFNKNTTLVKQTLVKEHSGNEALKDLCDKYITNIKVFVLEPKLYLKHQKVFSNIPEKSWSHKIKGYTNNKFMNAGLMSKLLSELLEFQHVEMRRAIRGLGEYQVAGEPSQFGHFIQSEMLAEVVYQALLDGTFSFQPKKIQHLGAPRKSALELFKEDCIFKASTRLERLRMAWNRNQSGTTETTTSKKRKYPAEDNPSTSKFNLKKSKFSMIKLQNLSKEPCTTSN